MSLEDPVQSKHSRDDHMTAGEVVTRRVVLRGGLAGLAATLAQAPMIGCSSDEIMDEPGGRYASH